GTRRPPETSPANPRASAPTANPSSSPTVPQTIPRRLAPTPNRPGVTNEPVSPGCAWSQFRCSRTTGSTGATTIPRPPYTAKKSDRATPSGTRFRGPGTDGTASEFPAKGAGNPWQSRQSPEGSLLFDCGGGGIHQRRIAVLGGAPHDVPHRRREPRCIAQSERRLRVRMLLQPALRLSKRGFVGSIGIHRKLAAGEWLARFCGAAPGQHVAYVDSLSDVSVLYHGVGEAPGLPAAWGNEDGGPKPGLAVRILDIRHFARDHAECQQIGRPGARRLVHFIERALRGYGLRGLGRLLLDFSLNLRRCFRSFRTSREHKSGNHGGRG